VIVAEAVVEAVGNRTLVVAWQVLLMQMVDAAETRMEQKQEEALERGKEMRGEGFERHVVGDVG
jgi:hypothetical protein